VTARDNRLGKVLNAVRYGSVIASKRPIRNSLLSGLAVAGYYGIRVADYSGIRYRKRPIATLLQPSKRYIQSMLKELSSQSLTGIRNVSDLWDSTNTQCVSRVYLGEGEAKYQAASSLIRSGDFSVPPVTQIYRSSLATIDNETSLCVLLTRERVGWVLTPLKTLASSQPHHQPLLDERNYNRTDERGESSRCFDEYSFICFSGARESDWPGVLAIRVVKRSKKSDASDFNSTKKDDCDVYLEVAMHTGSKRGTSDDRILSFGKLAAQSFERQLEVLTRLQKLRADRFVTPNMTRPAAAVVTSRSEMSGLRRRAPRVRPFVQPVVTKKRTLAHKG